MSTYVLYHAVCPDGFTAAWAAWKALRGGKYIPVKYGEPVPEIPDKASVYIVDFSYPRAQLQALHARSQDLIVLDHHKTAEADLVGLDYCFFDMNRSGAGLAWDFFNSSFARPALINYVEDRDLWRFALPHSKEVSAWYFSYPYDFQTWDRLAVDLATKPAEVVTEGRAILRARMQSVEMMVKQARRQSLGGYDVPVVNATDCFSEVAHRLNELYPDAPFAAYYFDCGDGKRQWGLRSQGEFDVSAVAKKLGGGGHKNAAGFVETV